MPGATNVMGYVSIPSEAQRAEDLPVSYDQVQARSFGSSWSFFICSFHFTMRS